MNTAFIAGLPKAELHVHHVGSASPAIVSELAAELAKQQVRYAELTLTPYTSVIRGIAAEAFCEAVEDARVRAAADHGIALTWCFDIPASRASKPPR